MGISEAKLEQDSVHLRDWLAKQQHGTMEYMERHAELRADPEKLVPGTLRIISVRMNYSSADEPELWARLADGSKAYVAQYALGRDYHKLMRKRLQSLADQIQSEIGPFGYRAFVDSAPVLERAIARDGGIGWIGKNTCSINRNGGSWFFIGELFTDLPLAVDQPASAHCGTCTRCIDICPTRAIISANRIDARRCISYLTIEQRDAIPLEFRSAIGNRIFGCDDCQIICPWNKFAKRHDQPDFRARNNLDDVLLVDLFDWSEQEFLQRTEGSAIRRTGYLGWIRNIAVALGNAPGSSEVLARLQSRLDFPDAMVKEHIRTATVQTSFVVCPGLNQPAHWI